MESAIWLRITYESEEFLWIEVEIVVTGIFNKGFDMDNFIEKRLLEIEDLEKRKSTRVVMTEVFRQIYRYTQAEYGRLEDKVEHELQCKNEHVIVTGIIDRDNYDITNDELFPMIPNDLEKEYFEIKDLYKSINEGKPYQIYSVFVEADYNIVKRIAHKEEVFPCKIRTVSGEYNGMASIRRQKRYNDILKKLYDLMQINAVQWNTVCAPYLYKIFDVYIETADIPEDDQIVDISIDFKEYTKYIHYNMIPVWNISEEVVIADVQPQACEDKIHYVHTIYEKRLKNNSKYLVAEFNETILDVVYADDLFITTTCSDAKKWDLYRIVDVSPKKYKYELMSNERVNAKCKSVKTQMGILKYLYSLGFHEYLEVKRISFPETFSDERKTYSMENYIDDEITIPQTNAVMLLEFECKNPNCFINCDLMSYFVTSLQREFREYKCIGVFY